jgi:hypothetical protein
MKLSSLVSILTVVTTTQALSLQSASSEKNGLSRRNAFATAFGMSALVVQAQASNAAGPVPTKEELDRIVEGYKQINYLLDNFEQETTTCKENGGECKRDAEPIRRVLGLRSTTDPLFQIVSGNN